MKGAAATGVAATGITAFSGSAAANPTSDDLIVDNNPALENDLDNLEIVRGNPNAVVEELNITFDEVDFDDIDGEPEEGDFDFGEEITGTASGTVTGTALPNQNANRNAARDIDTDFEDVEFTAIAEDVEPGDEVGNPTEVPEGVSELIRLELDGLFLDILGLQVRLSEILLLVTADPEGGLLGQLLAGLGREAPVDDVLL